MEDARLTLSAARTKLKEFVWPYYNWLFFRFGDFWRSTAHREVLYQRVFERELERRGILNDFYPFGAAANYSLLYVILRLVAETSVSEVVEFGAGQSSILMDRLKASLEKESTHRRLAITTFEHDAAWAERIGNIVAHRVVQSPLIQSRVGRRYEAFYEWDTGEVPTGFDFLLVDGPPFTGHNSRWGVLEYIRRRVADEFIIVFDDTSRFSEAQLVRKCRRMLRDLGLEFDEAKYRSTREHHIFFSPKYRLAKTL